MPDENQLPPEGSVDYYKAKYEVDMDTGAVVARQSGDGKHSFALQMTEDGRFVMPSLVMGDVALAQGSLTQPGVTSVFDLVKSAQSSAAGTQKADMATARHWNRFDPVASRCKRLLAQLANSTFTIACEDQETKTLFEKWEEEAMGHKFREAFFNEYFDTGMVPVFKTLIPYVPRNYRESRRPALQDDNVDSRTLATRRLVEGNKRVRSDMIAAVTKLAQAREMHAQGLCSDTRLAWYERNAASKQARWQAGMIPGSYTILDPLMVDIEGPKEMSWLREPFLQITQELRDAINSPTPQQKEVIDRIPSEIVAQIRGGASKASLPPNLCRIVYANKQPYERYPTPIVRSAFAALEQKYRLYEMDRATAGKVAQRILVVTIGNDTWPATDPAKIALLKNIFSNPNREYVLFWDHTLHLEWVEPDLDSLKDHQKYEIWDNQIHTAYGVNALLTGGNTGGGVVGNNALNYKGVEEVIAEAQQAYLEMFDEESRMVRAALSIKHEARGHFDQRTLRDEVKFWAMLNQLVINGILDEQSALEMMKLHYPTIESRMEKLKKLHEKGIFLPRPSANNLGPGGQGDQKNGGGTPTGGKPANQPLADNNSNKTDTSQPKRTKVAAKIVPDPTGGGNTLVIGDELDDEHRKQLMELLGLSDNAIVTEEQFTEQTGREIYLDDAPAWPQLTGGEIARAMRELPRVAREWEQDVQSRERKFKAESRQAAGRGPYLTAARSAELRKASLDVALQRMRPEGIDEDLWSQRVRSMAAEAGGEAEDHLSSAMLLSERARKWLESNS